MQTETNQKTTRDYIVNILRILEGNFATKNTKRMPIADVYYLLKELYTLFNDYFTEDEVDCSKLAKAKYLPLLRLMEKLDKPNYDVYRAWEKNATKMAARTSLENYFIYREWDAVENSKDLKDESIIYANRTEYIRGYIHYLEQIATNPKFHLLIANLPSGYGKQIADFEPVLTKNGFKKHGDLKVGDYVLSPTGKFVKVIEIHPKITSNRKVTFEDGETIVCHARHEWLVYDRHTHTYKILETDYLMEHLKEKDGRNRFLVKQTEPIEGEEKDLPVDPYTFGAWLGGDNSYKNDITEYKTTSKTIPNCYFTASKEQRLELLAGMLDSGGHLDKDKQRYTFSTTNESLRDGIVTLASSFGWRTSITKVDSKTSTSEVKEQKTTYYIGFSPNMYIPCKLKGKQLSKLHKQRLIGIVNVEEDNNGYQGNCISVEGGLYLVGKTLKVTHNSYPEKISEAWNFGIDPTGTVLYLCSNDNVVRGGSSAVRNELKSEWFGEVFPKMKYSTEDKTYFLKETETNWKLRDCKLASSYYAGTTNSNVVGVRASQRIHIDDLYKDYKEALNDNLNTQYFNDYLTVWRERFVQSKSPKIVVTGTLWYSHDFIAKLIEMLRNEYQFFRDSKYPYTFTNKDKTVAIVQVPALDYKTGLSVAPHFKSTEKILEIKRNIAPYLFETNYQQRPIDPDSLAFSYDKLKTYEIIPKDTTSDIQFCYAVIDATRKGKDFFAMPIFVPVKSGDKTLYYLKDCIFTKKATKDMYDFVVQKILEHHITKLVIESNVTSELANAIRSRLPVSFCGILEKYNTEVKAIRIQAEQSTMVNEIIYPQRKMFGYNTDMGQFMNSFTAYNLDGSNEHDDANDSVAMFCHEIIEGGSKPARIVPMVRPF